MKKLFLFFLLFGVLVQANPHIQNQRRRIKEQTYTRPVAGFVLYENTEALDKVIENNIIPNFEVISFSFLRSLEEKLDEIRNERKLEILYVEIIPFYDECRAFVIYEKKKEELKNTKLNWWE